MRIGLLTPRYFPEVTRGTERVVRELATDLARRGHRVDVLTSHRGLPRRAAEHGATVWRLPRLPGDGRLRARAFPDFLTHLPASGLALGGLEPELAHAFYATDGALATHWARRTGRRAVVSYNGLPNRKVLAARRGSIALLQRSVLPADAVVVPSAACARAAERWLGVAAHVIHPGVDLDVFRPGGERAETPEILCVAAADDDRKRVPLLVQALPEVRRARPGTRLVLIRPRDRDRARALEATEGVELIDPVDDPHAIAQRYRRAWVSALPAYDEAFGLVLAEALACGTPAVGRDDAGIPEVVGDQGALFAGDDPGAAARALIEGLDLAADGGTAQRCRARAERFGTREAGARHEALYRSLLS